MNSTSLLGLFVATVSWIPIQTDPTVERTKVPDHNMTSRTAHTELHIPLH
jgi:hypothetical protein